MTDPTVKCAAGCGGVLRNYEGFSSTAWAPAATDPEHFIRDGKTVICCPKCGAFNEIQSGGVQGVIKVIGIVE